jgi:hypothetical protein
MPALMAPIIVIVVAIGIVVLGEGEAVAGSETAGTIYGCYIIDQPGRDPHGNCFAPTPIDDR